MVDLERSIQDLGRGINTKNGEIVVRLFVAVNPNDSVRNSLFVLQRDLKNRSDSGNFVPIENFHLTLVFLGECDEKKTVAAKIAMDRIPMEPFLFQVEKIGYFRRRYGDIWWAGIHKDKKLLAFQRDLSKSFEKEGFVLDKREYNPHITLGRKVVTRAVPYAIKPFGMTAGTVDLMKSERQKGRLVYTSIHRRGKWGNPISVKSYDPQWETEFQRIQKFLTQVLGDLIVQIHHVGSTSVPGLCAKPVIDFDIEISSMDVFPRLVNRLRSLGYHHEGDYGISGREAFKRRVMPSVRADVSDGKSQKALCQKSEVHRRDTFQKMSETPDDFMKHHMYVCPTESPELRRHLAFRDYLRKNPGTARQYCELKKHLAEKHKEDIDAYVAGKTQFIKDVLQRKDFC